MKICLLKLLVVFLSAIGSVIWAADRVADPEIDDLLNVSPSARFAQATAAGDTSFIASPECSTAVVGRIPAYFLSQKGNTILDHNCRLLYGEQGIERYRRLRQYAWDYNHLMLSYMKANGLFNLWPNSTRRQLRFTPDAKAALEARGKEVLLALFGKTLPAGLNALEPELWKGNRLKIPFAKDKDGYDEREDFDSRLWQRAHVTAADFERNFQANGWHKIPFPQEFLERTGDKGFDKKIAEGVVVPLDMGGVCLVGKINDLPAYLVWFPNNELLNVIVALDPPKYIH